MFNSLLAFSVLHFPFPQALRWTVRNASFSVFSAVRFERCHLLPLSVRCRLFCSSDIQTTELSAGTNHEPRPPPGTPAPGLSVQSLRNMGFTDIQAELMWESVLKVRGGSVTKHALSTLTALFGLGLNTSSVLKLLQKCPELSTIKESQLQQRIGNLRKVGFVEGEIIINQDRLS